MAAAQLILLSSGSMPSQPVWLYQGKTDSSRIWMSRVFEKNPILWSTMWTPDMHYIWIDHNAALKVKIKKKVSLPDISARDVEEL